MSAQRLHDTLNQLPDDLIAATDDLRQRKKQPILRKRLVPLAACFALVLGALLVAMPLSGRKNAAPEAQMSHDEAYSEMAGVPETAVPGAEAEAPEAPMEQPPMADESGIMTGNGGAPLAPEEETDKSSAITETPVTVYGYFVGSEEPDETRITLISTWNQWEDYLAQMPRLTDAEDFENRYSQDYFEKNQLITVLTTAASSSVRYDIRTIRKTGSGSWELMGTRYRPELFTDDMEQQLLIVELPRMVEPEDAVTLNLTIENE